MHKCHALGCSVEVPPSLLMCKPHWRLVPRKLKLDIWRYYQKGQEVTKNPSIDYVASAIAAIFHVADIEKQDYNSRQLICLAGRCLAANKSPEELQVLIDQSTKMG
jgi:hypothetical protein